MNEVSDAFEAPPPGPPSDTRPGLPWEVRLPGETVSSAFATIRLVLLAPSDAFSRMQQTAGVGEPLLFGVIFGTIGAFFAQLWDTWMRSVAMSMVGGDFADLAVQNTLGVFAFIFTPFFVAFIIVLASAIYHLMLMLFGGAPYPYETTLRVVSYTTGATWVFNLIPLCGGLIGGLWGLVVIIIGLREAQEVPGGRAAAAVLVPILLLLLCCAFFAVTIFSLALTLPAAVS